MPRESTPLSDARAWVEVDLGALVRNARMLFARAGKPLVPMVKADAYGLGAVAVAKALESLEPMAFGVSSIPEGAELRTGGITRPVLLFTPCLPGDFARVRAARMTPTLASREGIVAWHASGGGPWHLAIDTGMHRAGLNHDAIDSVRDLVASHAPEGIFSHFHSSELPDGSMEEQEARFRIVLAKLPRRPRVVHTENSSAILRRGRSEWDCVRPGVALYGVGGGEPVAHLRARILEIRDVAVGEGVSYGVTWRAKRTSRIATVACGYADGYRRHLGNRAHGLVHGHVAPVAGVVTMDMTMLDVTDIECGVGDVVTLLGRDGSALLTADDVAAAGGLSPYELLVGLKLRLPRVHIGAT